MEEIGQLRARNKRLEEWKKEDAVKIQDLYRQHTIAREALEKIDFVGGDEVELPEKIIETLRNIARDALEEMQVVCDEKELL